jgi:hypothetical protein
MNAASPGITQHAEELGFISPEHQLTQFLDWNSKQSPEDQLGFALQPDLETGPNDIPDWPKSSDRLLVPILEITYETPVKTFAMACSFIKRERPPNEASLQFKTDVPADARYLRYSPGSETKPGIRWVTVDIHAHHNGTDRVHPDQLVTPAVAFPSHALLWLAGFCPSFMRRCNGELAPKLWLPGYQVSRDGNDSWNLIPYLSLNGSGILELEALHKTAANKESALPEFYFPAPGEHGTTTLDSPEFSR